VAPISKCVSGGLEARKSVGSGVPAAKSVGSGLAAAGSVQISTFGKKRGSEIRAFGTSDSWQGVQMHAAAGPYDAGLHSRKLNVHQAEIHLRTPGGI
jgi:hypothetical protein